MRKLCHKVLSRTGQIKHTFDKHWQYFCSSTDGSFLKKKKYYYYNLCESKHQTVPVLNIVQAVLIGWMDCFKLPNKIKLTHNTRHFK